LSGRQKAKGERPAAPQTKAAPEQASQAETKPAPNANQKPPASDGVMYVDATGYVAGRLCSVVAHEIIRGKRVVVLNAEKAIITGDRSSVVNQWKQRLELGSKVNPINGPLHPRRPDNILWRMVRGMVPKTKAKGTLGLKRLRVYMGVPERYAGVATSKVEEAMAARPLPLYITIGELSKSIGWNG
jgi:large subunit ribosomal protein L13